VWLENIDNSQGFILEDIVRGKTLIEVRNQEHVFFGGNNFYYKAPDDRNKTGWFVYNLKEGKTDKFTSEPSYWQNIFAGVVSPYDQNKMVLFKVGPWSIYMADADGLNEKKIADFKEPELFLSDLAWSSNSRYLLFTISRHNVKTKWILDINTGEYREMADPKLDELPYDNSLGGGKCDYKKGQYEVRYYDSKGRVTGLVDGKIKEEIPDSFYDEDSNTVAVFNTNDTYIYEIKDIKAGNYQMDHSSSEDGMTINFRAQNIPIFPGQIHRYDIDWKALRKGEKGTTVLIDANGDGNFEKTIKTGTDFTCEEFYSQAGI
jgi:hypothetical protein